jgi:adenylate cyclase 10
LNDTNILEDIKFSVKIGFGIGEIHIMYVGGVFNRCEFLAFGDAINQAYGS